MKTMSKFKKGMLIYSALLLVLTLAVWFAAWNYAAAYEKAQPKGAIGAYVENTLKGELAAQLEAYSAQKANAYQSAEEISAVMTNKVLEQEWTFRKSKRYSSSAPVYTLYCGGEALCEAELVAGEPGALSFGLVPWEVKPVDTGLEQLEKTVTIYAPGDCAVTLNGAKLPAAGDTPAAAYPMFAEYGESMREPLNLQVYTIPEIAVDALEVQAPAGYRVEQAEDAAYTWYVVAEADEVTLADIEAFAPQFVDAYLAFTSNSGGFYNVQRFLLPGGALLDRLHRSLDGMSWVHYTTGKVLDLDISNVQYYGNAFTFDAAYDLKIKSGDMAGNMHVTAILHPYGWRVTDLELF